MKLIICGGREYGPTPRDYRLLRALLEFFRPDVVMTGGARGVDQWAEKVARECGYLVETHEPDYERYPSRGAPLVRNTEMAKRAAPDGVCIAFPGDTGTGHMVGQSVEYGLWMVDLRGNCGA